MQDWSLPECNQLRESTLMVSPANIRLEPWTNFSLQDEPWAEFSTLEVVACVIRPGVAKQPNLELKTRPKQLLGSLPLVIALPARAKVTDSDKRTSLL